MYHGYTESEEKVNDRMNRRRLADIEATYGAGWEQDADAVREQVEILDIIDWMPEAEALAAEDEDARRTIADIQAGL